MMDLDELKSKATELFPLATKFALEHPGQPNPSLDALNALCADHYESLGFDCHAHCFGAIVPKITGRLSLEGWCDADLEISGWNLSIKFRPFYLGGAFAHFEIKHDGPLPGVTETGYRSVFTPLANLAAQSPLEFLASSIPQAPIARQLDLF